MRKYLIKLFLKILHFFNLAKGEYHIDDVTINIVPVYPENDISLYSFDIVTKPYVIEDIKNQIYNKFKSDIKFENRCRAIQHVYITFYTLPREKMDSSLIQTLQYIDGVLYYTYDKSENIAFKRAKRINEIVFQ